MKVYLDKQRIKDAISYYMPYYFTETGEQKKYTIAQLCRDTGVNYWHLWSSIEHKRATPTISMLLASHLGCPERELWAVDWTKNQRGK